MNCMTSPQSSTPTKRVRNPAEFRIDRTSDRTGFYISGALTSPTDSIRLTLDGKMIELNHSSFRAGYESDCTCGLPASGVHGPTCARRWRDFPSWVNGPKVVQ